MIHARIESFTVDDEISHEVIATVSQERGVFAVAKGFGGPQSGPQAADVACEAIHRFLHREAQDEDATFPFVLRTYYSLAGNVLMNALVLANRNVLAFNRTKGVHEKGGASAVAGLLDGDVLSLANVGTCDAVLVRDGFTRSLVQPRTYGRLVNPTGRASPGDAVNRIDQLPLTALGISDDLEPEVIEVRVRAGDEILLGGLPDERTVRIVVG